MAWIHPLYEEYQRRRFTRPDGQRFIRHDAHRFERPASPQAKSYAARVIEQRQAEENEARVAAEQEAFERAILELRWMVKDLKLELELRRIRHKYSPDQPRVPKGNPDGGQWTSDAGKDGGDDRVQLDEISAARRAGQRQPTQEVRRDQARGRAQQAVERVRQLDPDWQPRTVSLTQPDSIEGAIRHNEALAREADARFVELSRAGLDTNWSRRDPAPLNDVVMPEGQMIGFRAVGARENIRTVTPTEFESVRAELMVGARQIGTDRRYDGVRYQREDGSIFGLRLSRDHGLTLDVLESNHPSIPNGFRIHQR